MNVASAPARGAPTATSLLWPVATVYLGIALWTVSPHRDDYPVVVASILAFGLVPALAYRMRPVRATPICPVNWALLGFFLQLVLVPLLVCFAGPSAEVITSLPSHEAMNLAIGLSVLAYACFGVGYQAMASRRSAADLTRPREWPRPTAGLIALYAGIGLVGLGLTFHGLGSIFQYFGQTLNSQSQAVHRSPPEVLGLFLRAFLGFACVIAWCRWVARRDVRSARRAIWVTVLAGVALLVTYGTFSYNRGAFVAPLIALLGVYGLWVRRVSWTWLVVLAAVALVFLTAFRVYRASNLTPAEVVSNPSTLTKQTSIDRELQLYAGGPQFVGYLFEHTGYAAHLHYGTTLFSSVLYPVPKLGSPFRESSGVVIFNHLVHGPGDNSTDQILPFQGELFINFHLPGVVIGYLLLGAVFLRLQRRFERSLSPLQAFAWMYAAVWLGYLVVGGVASVSQVFLYFFWPIYTLAAWSWLGPRPGAPAA